MNTRMERNNAAELYIDLKACLVGIFVATVLYVLFSFISYVIEYESLPLHSSRLEYSQALKKFVCTDDPDTCRQYGRGCVAIEDSGKNLYRYFHPYCHIHGFVKKSTPCRHMLALFQARKEKPSGVTLSEGVCSYPFDYCFLNNSECVEVVKDKNGFYSVREYQRHPQCAVCGNYVAEGKCDEESHKSYRKFGVIDEDGTQKCFTLTPGVLQNIKEDATIKTGLEEQQGLGDAKLNSGSH